MVSKLPLLANLAGTVIADDFARCTLDTPLGIARDGFVGWDGSRNMVLVLILGLAVYIVGKGLGISMEE